MSLELGRWDRFLMGLFPRWGLRRVHARAAAAATVRSYEAAGSSRRTYGWRSTSSDADAANAPAIARLRDLSRDLYRNNDWARRGIHCIAHSVVGWGIEPTAIASEQITDRLGKLWRGWADTPACDVHGRMPFAGLARLAMETVARDGECLVLRKTPPRSLGLEIPLQIKIAEADLIDTSRDLFSTAELAEGHRVSEGIEFDADGRRVAYWLFARHPGSSIPFDRGGLVSQRVPAEDVLHIYRVERPGQNRGVSWLASSIARLHDYDEFEDAELMAKKIAACFAAFVTDITGDAPPLGNKVSGDNLLESLEPGMVEYMPVGRDVKFATPPQASDQGFSQRNLRRIAAGLGVTYEDLTGDYSQVNFSSARMARLAHQRHVWDWQFNMLIPQLCDGVWGWVSQLALDSFRLGRLAKAPAAEWSPPPLPMLEPEKEGLAYQRMLRNGVMTFGEMCRERGRDPRRQLAEIAEFNRLWDEEGIVLDCDPRMTTSSGQVQSAPPEATPAEPTPADEEE